jgi:hypothetical protein
MGDWTLDRINKSACTNYRDYRLQTVASRTIRAELGALRAALHLELARGRRAGGETDA